MARNGVVKAATGKSSANQFTLCGVHSMNYQQVFYDYLNSIFQDWEDMARITMGLMQNRSYRKTQLNVNK